MVTESDSLLEQLCQRLRDVVADFADNAGATSNALRTLQKNNPVGFANAAVSVLGSATGPSGLTGLARYVAAHPEVIEILLSPGRLPLAEAVCAARLIQEADPQFLVRMTQKILEACGHARDVPTPLASRLLNVLDHGSACPGLTPMLVRFANHPSDQVRSKSILLLGRANLNLPRAKEFLLSTDARVRANTIESLWDLDGEECREVLLEYSRDRSSRVMLNSLVGLCKGGNSQARARLICLAGSHNATVRAGAAWAMGKVDRPHAAAEFIEILNTLAQDPEPKVQNMARGSLEKLADQSRSKE